MTETGIRCSLGQSVAPHQLSSLARQIAARMGDGTPAQWAGFVWYSPESLAHQNVLRQMETLSPSKAA
jgi:hypothetical protein